MEVTPTGAAIRAALEVWAVVVGMSEVPVSDIPGMPRENRVWCSTDRARAMIARPDGRLDLSTADAATDTAFVTKHQPSSDDVRNPDACWEFIYRSILDHAERLKAAIEEMLAAGGEGEAAPRKEWN